MKSKTIVLWGREDLLSTSVELFLKVQQGWQVFTISREDPLDVLIQVIDGSHADAVIIHQANCRENAQLPGILLQNHPGLKVIFVSPNNNLMEVYGKQNILVTSSADLISTVETDMFSLPCKTV